jgi:hypothetical protein
MGRGKRRALSCALFAETHQPVCRKVMGFAKKKAREERAFFALPILQGRA